MYGEVPSPGPSYGALAEKLMTCTPWPAIQSTVLAKSPGLSGFAIWRVTPGATSNNASATAVPWGSPSLSQSDKFDVGLPMLR